MQGQSDFDEQLEKPDSLVWKDVDLDILQTAGKYNVNLDDLEKYTQRQETEILQQKGNKNEWQNLDVNLADVLNLMVSSSERPSFIIRDDKVVYVNQAAVQMLDEGNERNILGCNFFDLVNKEDWNLLAASIGEMLTNAKAVNIRMVSTNGKIRPMSFRAIYLSDIDHFSFILIGEHNKKAPKVNFNSLYDDVTGLPNFFLFEDRVQVAVTGQNAKTNIRDQSMVMVAAVNIDNIEVFRKMQIQDAMIKKIANTLVLNLPKNVTVSQGLKYSFWLMWPDVKNKEAVNNELRRVFELLEAGVSDNLTRHELVFSIGASVFPQPAHSAKKLIEQAIAATQKAQEKKESSLELFTKKDI